MLCPLARSSKPENNRRDCQGTVNSTRSQSRHGQLLPRDYQTALCSPLYVRYNHGYEHIHVESTLHELSKAFRCALSSSAITAKNTSLAHVYAYEVRRTEVCTTAYQYLFERHQSKKILSCRIYIHTKCIRKCMHIPDDIFARIVGTPTTWVADSDQKHHKMLFSQYHIELPCARGSRRPPRPG